MPPLSKSIFVLAILNSFCFLTFYILFLANEDDCVCKSSTKTFENDCKFGGLNDIDLELLCQGNFANNHEELAMFSDNIYSPIVNHIFIKTHKTGSTTMGALFFRFGVRRALKFVYPDRQGHYLKIGSNLSPGNLTVHHLNEYWRGNVRDAIPWLKSKVPLGKFITIIREPISRALSAYDYYIAPVGISRRLSLKDALVGGSLRSVTERLGIHSEPDLNWFMTVAMKDFSIILILEKFDESLLLMKRLFHWTLEDILYVKMFDSCQDQVRYDGRKIVCRKSLTDNGITMEMIEEAKKTPQLQLELKLYNESLNRLNTMLSQQKEDFWEELKLFKRKLQWLNEKCKPFARNLSKENAAFVENPNQFGGAYPCFPYILSDAQYEKWIYEGRGRVFDFPGLYKG